MRSLALLILLSIIATHSNCEHKVTYPELRNVSEIVIMDEDNQLRKSASHF
jgi:hypothetical protein